MAALLDGSTRPGSSRTSPVFHLPIPASVILILLLLLIGALAFAGWPGRAQAADDPSVLDANVRALAEERGAASREAFERARGVLRGWWAHRDPKSGLLPRRLDQPVWAPQDNAADMFPFLILTARLADPARMEDVLSLFRIEIALTTRVGTLPDWYSLKDERFLNLEPDLRGIIFGAAEYCKDGLIPLTEFLGPGGVWYDRMVELIDGIFERAPIPTDFGAIPADDGEVNGDVLQVLGRLHSLTRDRKYLDWAVRIGDAYLLEAIPKSGDLPPGRWDWKAHRAIDDRLSLNDHGNEIIGGLSELFIAVKEHRPEKAAQYEPALRRMFDTLLAKARNPDGLWYSLLRTTTGEVLGKETPDTWGYALTAVYTFGLATGDPRYARAVGDALSKLDQERYRTWDGADSYADSIEGGLLLLNRLPEREKEFLPWLRATLAGFYACQRPDGVVEAWYGDGNFARTALMAALYFTRGAWLSDWRDDLRLGGVEDGKDLVLVLSAGKPWSGRLHLDRPRHRDFLRLPVDYPRLNQFPEWYVVKSTRLYRVTVGKAEPALRLGAELIEGIPLSVDDPQAPVEIRISPAGEPPYGKERAPDRAGFEQIRAEDPAVAQVAYPRCSEEYAGEPYGWAGPGPIELRFAAAPADGGPYSLWLHWGAKGDVRRGFVEAGGRRIPMVLGGYQGFEWTRVDIPASAEPFTARVVADPSALPAPFISQARLRRCSASLDPDGAAETCWIETEALEGPWRLQSNIPGFRGKGFRTSNAEGISTAPLKGSISIRKAGKFAVWTRGYRGQGQDRSYSVMVQGKALPPAHRGTAPQGFSWELAGIVDLVAGEAALEVRDAGMGFEAADSILITSDLHFDPGLPERLSVPPIDGAAENARLAERVIAETTARARSSHQANAKEMAGTKEGWAAARSKLLLELRSALGLEPLPERTPLEAKLLGETVRDGYRIQRVVYRSRPDFPVTANVYVPADRGLADAKGRLPAVLCPLGHWGLSKAEPVVQARCVFLARRGFLVLAYDPFGQGEREVPGNDHSESFRAAPAGLINMSFMVWDTVRGLDYLLERGDADPDRIGSTGASGGGLNTLYAAAVDERIRVAVPAVYLTTFEEFLKTRIEHCPCSHVPGLVRFADMGDVLALLAPRPTLLLAARADDMFTIPGARAAREEALPAYRLLGAEGRLGLLEFDGPHDYNRLMREAMVGWMEKHLLGRGDGSPVPEPPFTSEPAASPALRCFPEGKVPADAETVASISLREAKRLAGALPASPGEPAREMLRRILGWDGVPAIDRRERLPAADLRLPESVVFTIDGVAVPALRYGKTGAKASVVFVSSEGAARASSSALFRALREGPFEVWVVDLPGWGSTGGREHLLQTDSLLLGEPMITRRARALAAVRRSLRTSGGDSPAVLVAADGAAAGLTALISKALDPGPAPLAIRGLPGSLADLLAEGPSPETAAFGILRAADLPQLVRLSGGPVKVIQDDAGLEELVGWLRGPR